MWSLTRPWPLARAARKLDELGQVPCQHRANPWCREGALPSTEDQGRTTGAVGPDRGASCSFQIAVFSVHLDLRHAGVPKGGTPLWSSSRPRNPAVRKRPKRAKSTLRGRWGGLEHPKLPEEVNAHQIVKEGQFFHLVLLLSFLSKGGSQLYVSAFSVTPGHPRGTRQNMDSWVASRPH